MATIDLGAARPPATGVLDALPRRLSLTLTELLFVAEHAGGAPLPFAPPEAPRDAALGGRLGPSPDTTDAAELAAALEALHDPRASLARRGLLVDTALDEGVLGAVGLLAAPAVALDLDVTAGPARARAWHRQRGDAVASLATADGVVFELAWFPTDRWADELGRVAVVPEDLPVGDCAVPDRLDLPYALLDAAAEAVRSNRADLLSVLVAQHDAGLDLVPVLTALATGTRGRLRAMVADVSGERTTAVGVLSWLLLADGWRGLRPHDAGRVEVRRVQPADLATELAPVLAEACA
ncbi:MAG TPA: hypothetical protein VFT70_12950 [Nocardioides sp.]|nr:hypothetical protein [Nocardioides sp.]